MYICKYLTLKSIGMVILLSIFAGGFALSKSEHEQAQKLKSIWPDILFYKVGPSHISQWNKYHTNLGNIYIDKSGQYVVLLGQEFIMLNDEEGDSIKELLNYNFPENHFVKIEKIEGNLYEVQDDKDFSGIYDSKSHYLLVGGITSIDQLDQIVEKDQEVVSEKSYLETLLSLVSDKSLSQEQKNIRSIKALETYYPNNVVTYAATDKEIGHLYVLTDYTCAYCKKLHRNVHKFNQAGYSISYILFPRKGLKSKVAENMTAALCEVNQEKAVNGLYFGVKPHGQSVKDCDIQLANNVAIGKILNISGTPLLVNNQGKLDKSGFKTVKQTINHFRSSHVK